jgi:poly(glycerol-phosphate) alpha-glucosyltransferase
VKITHVVPYKLDPFSGVYTSITGICAGLARAGHDVELWSLSPWPGQGLEMAAELDEAGVRRITVPPAAGPWRLTRGAKQMFNQLSSDVLHLHAAFSPQNNLLLRRVNLPTVLSPHGVYSPESLVHSKLKKQVFKRLIELPSLRKIDAVCGLTEPEAEEAQTFGYQGRIEVIPNGVSEPLPDLDDGRFRSLLGLGADERLGLFVGRIDLHHKRIDEIAMAVAQSPGWHLAVVGPDYRGDEARLRALIGGLDGGERVHIVGSLRGRELGEAFAGADLFLLLSRFEGMPMSLLEALSHGLPAVVSSGVEEAVPVAASGAGWEREPSELSDLLGRLAADPEQLNSAQRQTKDIIADYRWDAVAAAYGDLYGSLLRGG